MYLRNDSYCDFGASTGLGHAVNKAQTGLETRGGLGINLRTSSSTAAFTVQGPAIQVEPAGADTIPSTINGANPVITAGTSITGYTSGPSDTDLFRLDVVAGQSYLIDVRGTGSANPNEDAILYVRDSTGAQIGFDDDGGQIYGSLYTYTATTNGTIYLGVSSFWDSGEYKMTVASSGADEDAGGTSPQLLSLDQTNYGFLTSGDNDFYAVWLEAGQYYTFQVSTGADYNTNYQAVPAGELDTFISLYNAQGQEVAYNDDENFDGGDIGSAIGYYASTSGYYYLNVDAYGSQRGGYTIDANRYDLATMNPLDAIDWGSQLSETENITVYFAKAGETFAGVTSLGWTDYEIQQMTLAFAQFDNYINASITIVDDPANATFKMVSFSDPDSNTLGRMRPPGEANEGVGEFNVSVAWDRDGPFVGTDYNGALEQGGYGFVTLIHELGHGFGLAHPHDTGGTSTVMPGVFAPFDSYGAFDLNQGVYTMMSYNTGFPVENGPGGYYYFGWEGTMSALDVALLQQKYGASERNEGDTVYTLDQVNYLGTFYETIWDTGGNDTFLFNGAQDVYIDLTAATLDYSATGAGVLSHADGIRGGFTIANGVVIENATGGSGNDILIGNAADNVLTGNAGNDTMLGRDGIDKLFGGVGNDVLNGGQGMDELTGGAGVDTFVFEDLSKDKIRDFKSGVDKIDLSAFGITAGAVKIAGSNLFADTDQNGSYDLHIVVQGSTVLMSDIMFV